MWPQERSTSMGSKVSIDQFVSSVKGYRFDTKGKEPDDQKFVGGTIFVDLSSGFMQSYPQTSLCASVFQILVTQSRNSWVITSLYRSKEC